MAQRNQGNTPKKTFNSREFDRLTRKLIARGKLLKQGRILLIRDGSHNTLETQEAILQKTGGQHSRAIRKSLKLSKANAQLLEATLNELEIDMEAELNTLPPPARYKLQKKIRKLRAPAPKPIRPKTLHAPRSRSRETFTEYANRKMREQNVNT